MPATGAKRGPIKCPVWVSPDERCKGSLIWDHDHLTCTLGGERHVPEDLRGWRPGR